MFGKLRRKIILVTMAITTAVLVLAGGMVMLFHTKMRPEPKEFPERVVVEMDDRVRVEMKEYIEGDREEGNRRLLVTLLGVGIAVEGLVFLISYDLSSRMVKPVQDAYDKQKMFIANASHELKTPLAVIQANMEALEVTRGSEKWKDNVETEIARANKLVLDLLQLAKMDAGSLGRSKVEKVDLAKELEQRVERFRPKFGGKITLKVGEKREWFLAKQEVLQVADILLDNATKYGERKIVVTLGKDGFWVENDGAKIKKEDREKIFDRFYQTDKTKEGSGLGLAIAKALCEQNGWTISCEGEGRVRFLVKLG
ncbi:HAMP domain-containing histidine kinase [Candidatus Saccharibacteria bacterium]|nr:HAMP domain-containing histidine kinase [Candidatus Saccharibacteria bacterium]